MEFGHRTHVGDPSLMLSHLRYVMSDDLGRRPTFFTSLLEGERMGCMKQKPRHQPTKLTTRSPT